MSERDPVFAVLMALWLATTVLLVGLLVTRRVIIAWWTYFAHRRDPRFQTPEGRDYLWKFTLARANGRDYTPEDAERDARQ